jgi:hypothetical protein
MESDRTFTGALGFNGLLGSGAAMRPGGASGFPQYGGNSRTAQMMNSYMGGLLSRRTPYMPPNVSRQGMGSGFGVPANYTFQQPANPGMPAWAPPSGYMIGGDGRLIQNNFSMYEPSANG